MPKQDKSLAAMAANKDTHQAIYNALAKKNVSCEGLQTNKDDTVTIINADKEGLEITTAEIQAELEAIKIEQNIEMEIQAEILLMCRTLAIDSLKAKNKIPKDYK